MPAVKQIGNVAALPGIVGVCLSTLHAHNLFIDNICPLCTQCEAIVHVHVFISCVCKRPCVFKLIIYFDNISFYINPYRSQ